MNLSNGMGCGTMVLWGYRVSAKFGSAGRRTDQREGADNPPPAPDLAPGTALGSLPSVALSSAQVTTLWHPDRISHNYQEQTT
jgi:hypothetical protein